jgi:hypothetical protein
MLIFLPVGRSVVFSCTEVIEGCALFCEERVECLCVVFGHGLAVVYG